MSISKEELALIVATLEGDKDLLKVLVPIKGELEETLRKARKAIDQSLTSSHESNAKLSATALEANLAVPSNVNKIAVDPAAMETMVQEVSELLQKNNQDIKILNKLKESKVITGQAPQSTEAQITPDEISKFNSLNEKSGDFIFRWFGFHNMFSLC